MRLILLLSMAALLAEARKERNGRKKAKKAHKKRVKKFEKFIRKRRGCVMFPIIDADIDISVGFSVNNEIEYRGESIEETNHNNIKACASYCANRAGCNFFNFYASTKACLLFSETDGAIENKDCTTGMLNASCGNKFYPVSITSKIQFVINHYTDGFNIVPLEPMTPNSIEHLLSINSMMGPMGGKGDYWIDRQTQITEAKLEDFSSHFVFELYWKHSFRVFEDTLSFSDATKFVETQISFIEDVITEHTKFIEKNVKTLLSQNKKALSGPFSLETFYDNELEIWTADASCSFADGKLDCSCPEGFDANGIECIDKNECFTQGVCAGDCFNLPGNFTCLDPDISFRSATPACPAGFIGDFPNCVDVNECNDDPCDESEVCHNKQGYFTCSCPGGLGDGLLGCSKLGPDAGCINIECGDHGHCEIQDGEQRCVCDNGFFGDGHVCGEVDECRAKTHDCDENAQCTNTYGGYECTCNWTWHEKTDENGKKFCADIDECQEGTHKCDSNAACLNHDNGYTCTCSNGYQGNGFHCTDIDECAEIVNVCQVESHDETESKSGECTNTDGSFSCACPTGYKFDLDGCVDVNECLDKPCMIGASCHNEMGGFRCQCRRGFVMNHDHTECVPNQPIAKDDSSEMTHQDADSNVIQRENYSITRSHDRFLVIFQGCLEIPDFCIFPQVCHDSPIGPICLDREEEEFDYYAADYWNNVSACASGNATCPDNSECWDTNTGYTCNCDPGYEMDLNLECSNVNECSRGTDTCDINAECIDTDGNFECFCNYGYAGDGFTCEEGFNILDFVAQTRLKMNEAIDSIIYRGQKKLREVTYDRMKRKGGRVIKQLYLLLSNELCDQHAPFNDAIFRSLVRQREKPTRFKVASAIRTLKDYGRQNCPRPIFDQFSSKFDSFLDNFIRYKISG